MSEPAAASAPLKRYVGLDVLIVLSLLALAPGLVAAARFHALIESPARLFHVLPRLAQGLLGPRLLERIVYGHCLPGLYGAASDCRKYKSEQEKYGCSAIQSGTPGSVCFLIIPGNYNRFSYERLILLPSGYCPIRRKAQGGKDSGDVNGFTSPELHHHSI